MRNQAKRDAQAGIVRHDNKNDLGIPNSLLFQVGTHSSIYRGLENTSFPKEKNTTDLRDVQEHQEAGGTACKIQDLDDHAIRS